MFRLQCDNIFSRHHTPDRCVSFPHAASCSAGAGASSTQGKLIPATPATCASSRTYPPNELSAQPQQIFISVETIEDKDRKMGSRVGSGSAYQEYERIEYGHLLCYWLEVWMNKVEEKGKRHGCLQAE